jgi:16S rRNA G966 N2-methylase RsmD
MRSFVKEWNLPAQVVLSDVYKFIRETSEKWDYVFADPPYDMNGIENFPDFMLHADVLSPGGFFVLEHISTKSFNLTPGFKEARHYGQSVFSFFGAGS